MIIPQLPTDNLYKFMSLSGLFLFVFGCALFWFNEDKVNQIKGEILEYQSISDVSRSINKRVYKYKGSPLMNLEASAIGKERSLKHELRVLYDKQDIVIYIIIFLCSAGFILSTTGFTLWYIRVQKYHDILLRNESVITKNKFKKK